MQGGGEGCRGRGGGWPRGARVEGGRSQSKHAHLWPRTVFLERGTVKWDRGPGQKKSPRNERVRDGEKRKEMSGKERSKPWWKIRGKRREGRQSRAEGRRPLEHGGCLSWAGPLPGRVRISVT